MKKMKKMKKTMAILFAMIMVFCMSMVVSAADPTYGITINKAANDTAAHTYQIYQIFKGKLVSDTSKVLTDITWGDTVDGTALLADLCNATKNPDHYGDFSATMDAAAVAKKIDELGDTFAETLAKLVSNNLVDGVTYPKELTIAATATSGTINDIPAGYYFIKDKAGTLTGESGAYTKFMLKVVKNIDITAKAVVPTLIKKILDGTPVAEVDANTASIGDVVNYQITTAVPDTTAYNKYFFIINDTLSAGLTFNPTSVVVSADGTALAATAYTVKTGTDAAPYTFQIVLKNAKTYSGQAIVVKYSATLNENADRSVAGNPNEADLTYANDPNQNYGGDPGTGDEPGPGEVTGKTPKSRTITYTTGIKIEKIDGDTRKALTGAKFSLTGDGVYTVITVAQTYTADAAGTYWKLKNGTYTDTAPTTLTEDDYDSTTTKYVKGSTTSTNNCSTNHTYEAYVDPDGFLTFEGLGAGTYSITELEAPSGYNTVDPVTVTIEAAPTPTAPNWSIGGTDLIPDTNNIIKVYQIENFSGVELPETGGIGTTIFYVVGGLLVLLAAALLITKIRMRKKEQ